MKEKKTAVWVTGASSGIGKAIALEFIRNGIDVVASSRKVDSLKKNKDEFNDLANFGFNVKYMGIMAAIRI